MLTARRTEVSSHPWIVSYNSSLCRYWGHCYLGDSAPTPLLRHPWCSTPRVCALSYLPCFGSNPLVLLTMSSSFYFDPFPMSSLNHSALSPYITKFLNRNYSQMPVWTQQPTQYWCFPSCSRPAGLGLTLRGSTAQPGSTGLHPYFLFSVWQHFSYLGLSEGPFLLKEPCFLQEVSSVAPFLGPHSLLTLSCCLY